MANLNLSEFGEKLFVADADHTFIWDSAASISKRVSRNSWLSGTTADFHLGLADAATAVAQTISVQSVVAGTTNTAGANFSINGSQGTGTGAGGSLLLRTAPAGSSGTAQNALVTAVAITSAGNVGIGTTAPRYKLSNTSSFLTDWASIDTSTSGIGWLISEANKYVFSFHNSAVGGYGMSIYANSNGTQKLLTLSNNSADVVNFLANGNVGIGTTSPSSKLHVAGNSSPSITVDNTLATGASRLLFKNTVVTGDTDGIFLNGSTQTGFGGAGSLNVKATTGPIAFHTATVTNALSIAQSGTCTHAGHLIFAPDNTYDIGASGANRPRNVYVGGFLQSGSGNAGGFYIGAFGGVTSYANGVFTWWNGTSNNFDRFQLGGTTDSFPAVARDGAGIKFTGAAAGSTSWIKVPPVAVSALPLAATAGAGARAFVNDASAPVFGTAVTGGGAVLVPVYSDGSAWNVG